MKSQILKLTTLIVLLTAGGFSSTAQNNESLVPSSTAFAIDKNIISVEISNLVDTHMLEHAPYPDYGGGGPNVWSPHFWTIKMFMAEGIDVTSLAPIINLAPGAAITSQHARVQDFSQPVEYTVICEDGSTVTYFFSAYTENTRAQGTVFVECLPPNSGITVPGGAQNYNDNNPFSCGAMANAGFSSFERWYVNGSPKGTSPSFYDYIPLDNAGRGTLTAKFVLNPVYYTVGVINHDLKGTVSGGGRVLAGGSVPVSATPNPGNAFEGYAFEGWYLRSCQ